MRTTLTAIHWNVNEHLEATGYRFVERTTQKFSKVRDCRVDVHRKTQVESVWKIELNDLAAASSRSTPLQHDGDNADEFAMRAIDEAFEVERADWPSPEASSDEEFYHFSDDE